MASRTLRREWVRGLPWAFGVGRYDRKRIYSVSERPVGYVFLIGESVRNHPTLTFTKQALKEVPARLANIILLLCEGEGVMTPQGIKIPHHYTHERLGTMIGANREAVTRAFSKLQDEGAIELRRRIIHVRDIEALRRVAGGLAPQDINP
jgi:hypothetical protein